MTAATGYYTAVIGWVLYYAIGQLAIPFGVTIDVAAVLPPDHGFVANVRAACGADIVARSLERLGASRVFTLSGNHIMSLFDAALGRPIDPFCGRSRRCFGAFEGHGLRRRQFG